MGREGVRHACLLGCSTDKLFFKAVLAAIYIFCFVDMAPGNRRFRYAFFYAVMFAENALLLGLWYRYAEPTPWYHTVALLGSFCSFCMGIMFLVCMHSCVLLETGPHSPVLY